MRIPLLQMALAATLLAACGGSDDEASLVPTAGDGVTGYAGNFTPELPEVRVRDGAGTPVDGVRVTFAVEAGGGSVVFPEAITDADGRASPGAWRFGPAGTQRLRATAEGYGSVQIGATATAPPASAFDIDLRLLDPQPTDQQRAAFEAARDRWQQVVLGDVSDFSGSIPQDLCDTLTVPTVSPPVDDVVIFAGIRPLDGQGRVLAQAGPCLVRGSSGLPLVGIVLFDSADLGVLTANASLGEVAFHEMAHALGFGTIWTSRGLLEGGTTPDPTYTGEGGRQAYQAMLAQAARTQEASVPVEGGGGPGTAFGHWRESVFDDEIMTGFYDGGAANPLSAMSIASLRDLGYAVDDTRGDAFSLASRLANAVAGGPGLELREALAPWHIQAVDDAGRPIHGVSR